MRGAVEGPAVRGAVEGVAERREVEGPAVRGAVEGVAERREVERVVVEKNTATDKAPSSTQPNLHRTTFLQNDRH